jgi:NAD(P)-dependent dehydrogenase (short-subunit alcohol dehydrogenase family)
MAGNAKGAVFITGASGGIGFATGRALTERGFQIFGSHLPSEDDGALRGIGVTPVALDVTSASSVDAARDQVARALGDLPLVGLVNNAGIADGGPIELADLEAVRRMLEVNVFGVFAVTKAFLPALRTAKGRVVNVSSVSGRFAAPFLGAYCACKFALEAFSDSLRREMLPFGVDVVVIRPAITRTAIWDRAADVNLGLFRGTGYEEVAAKVQERMLKAKRKGLDPALVAAAIVRALTEAKPPTRIAVLRKGKLRKYLLSGWLPDRMVDRVVAQKIWD